MSQFLNLINSVADGDNLSLLSSLSGPVQDKIKETLGGNIDNLKNAGDVITENVSQSIEQSAPVLSNSINSVSKVYRWRGILIGFLVLWTVFMIISRILIKDEEAKKNIESTNSLLFGNTGVFPLILYIWVGSIILITIIPAILAVTPKLEDVLGVAGNLISAFVSGK